MRRRRRRSVSVCVLVLAAGGFGACGRINYDPIMPRVDAASPTDTDPVDEPRPEEDLPLAPPEPDAPPGSDAAVPDALANMGCPATTPFSEPALVTVEGLMPHLFGPRLSPDGLTLYLSQTRGTPFRDEDVWTVTRESPDSDRFTGATRLDRVSSTAFDGSPFLTSDGLEIFFSSARPGGSGNRDVWVTRRADVNGAFGAPVALTMINSAANDQNPSLTADGLLLFFASDRDGVPADDDVYLSFRSSKDAPFSRPLKMPGLASPAKETAPFISPGGESILFGSDRPGGQGGLDIWTARRNNRFVGFETPTLVPGVSSPGHDDDPALSPDGRELFFSSERAGKDFQIYRAVRCR